MTGASAGGSIPSSVGAVVPNTPGHASGVLTAASQAATRCGCRATSRGALAVRVDGRAVGSVAGSNTPGQWLQAASLQLKRRPHTLRVIREAGHAHFGPGEWNDRPIGAVALQSEAPPRLRSLPLARWRSLCGAQADWVELVRP